MKNIMVDVSEFEHLYVAGAGKKARQVLELTRQGIIRKKIERFLVTSVEENPTEIEGIPVCCVEDESISRTGAAILVCAPFNEMTQVLIDNSYTNIFSLKSIGIESLLRKLSIKKMLELDKDCVCVEKRYGEKSSVYFEYPGVGVHHKCIRIYEDRIECISDLENGGLIAEYERLFGEMHMLADYTDKVRIKKTYKNLECRIFMSLSHVDRSLKDEIDEPWVVPVQAGACLTDKKLCDIKDNIGDNISCMNADLCECTALYWIWKNMQLPDYIGFCHYRRRIVIPDNDILATVSTGADMILTTPLYTAKNLRNNFVCMFLPGDWGVVEEQLNKFFPDYVECWKKLEIARCYLPCNIGIFRKEIFKDYCEFAFKVMGGVIDHYKRKNVIRMNRYAGFIMELLMSTYVMKHKDEYKILYTDFNFLR